MDRFYFDSDVDGVRRGYKTFAICITQCKNHLRKAYKYSCGNSITADVYQFIQDSDKLGKPKLLETIRLNGEEFIEEAAE